MTLTVRRAPNLRKIASAWLRQEFPELATRPDGTLLVRFETPVDLRTLLEAHRFFVRVGAIPGRTNRHEIRAVVDFDVFALTDADASDLALDIDAAVHRPYLRVAETGASLQNVINQMSPVTVPWADAGVRRYYSSYAVTARR